MELILQKVLLIANNVVQENILQIIPLNVMHALRENIQVQEHRLVKYVLRGHIPKKDGVIV